MAYFGTGPTVRPNYSHTAKTPQAGAGPLQSQIERTNAYGARCVKCHVWVEPGVGRLTKGAAGRWVVSHIPPCPETTPVVTETVTTAPVATEAVVFSVPDGRYTVVFNDSHKTIRVSRQDQDATFMPGRVILGYLSGTDNNRDYTSFANVDESGTVKIWKKHLANGVLREAVKTLLNSPDAASTAYALESGNCSRCGRSLTVPASLNAGVGPECAKKRAM